MFVAGCILYHLHALCTQLNGKTKVFRPITQSIRERGKGQVHDTNNMTHITWYGKIVRYKSWNARRPTLNLHRRHSIPRRNLCIRFTYSIVVLLVYTMLLNQIKGTHLYECLQWNTLNAVLNISALDFSTVSCISRQYKVSTISILPLCSTYRFIIGIFLGILGILFTTKEANRMEVLKKEWA